MTVEVALADAGALGDSAERRGEATIGVDLAGGGDERSSVLGGGGGTAIRTGDAVLCTASA
nr:hypothetical protein GCM10025699_05440 [Microbacterium flavescens]